MKKFIWENRYFLFPLLMFWMVLGFLLLAYGYHDSFLVMNSVYFKWLDYPMLVLTRLGDSFFLSALMLLLFMRKDMKMVMVAIVAVILTGVIAQILKHWVFNSWNRPLTVFEGKEMVHYVGNYILHKYSFPSGHSTTTAAAFTVISWHIRKRKVMSVILGVLTVLVSYTRIYLGAHFPGDVLAGNLLGFAGAFLTIRYLEPVIGHYFSQIPTNKRQRWQRSLFIAALIVMITMFFSPH